MSLRAFTQTRTAAVIGASALLVTMGGVGGAVAAGQIGSSDIRDGGVHTQDIHNHAVTGSKLSNGVLRLFRHHLEADGPYPGLTQLQQGANSTQKWAGNSTALQESWVQCARHKSATGGGFGQYDEGAEAAKNIQIVTSRPAIIRNGTVVDTPSIPGDVDQSIRPNGWVVQGFNNGATDIVVRPWVVCAVMR
jgi:hypothetical protein